MNKKYIVRLTAEEPASLRHLVSVGKAGKPVALQDSSSPQRSSLSPACSPRRLINKRLCLVK